MLPFIDNRADRRKNEKSSSKITYMDGMKRHTNCGRYGNVKDWLKEDKIGKQPQTSRKIEA